MAKVTKTAKPAAKAAAKPAAKSNGSPAKAAAAAEPRVAAPSAPLTTPEPAPGTTPTFKILGQYLKTNDEIGYVVLDVDKQLSAHALELLKGVKATIKVRMLY